MERDDEKPKAAIIMRAAAIERELDKGRNVMIRKLPGGEIKIQSCEQHTVTG